MKEYMAHIWGGAWNKDANPSIEKDLGIKEGYHYFKTKEERDRFLKLIKQDKYLIQGLVWDLEEGELTHKRTIFVADLKYKDMVYTIHYDCGYEYPEEEAIFMFEDGNYSCDCNRSLFIQDEYGENAIDELDCGEEIKMLNYHLEYLD